MTTDTTTEPCPECGAPATCEHGVRDERDRLLHTWQCLFCGTLTGIVCYDCQVCAALDRQRRVGAILERYNV